MFPRRGTNMKTRTFLCVMLWLPSLTCVISQIGTNFTVVPVTQTVNIQENAVFRCKHPTADTYRWKVNGTLLRASMLPLNITLHGDSLVQTLTVVGRQEYNGTRVVCVANFDDGSQPQETETAMLYVTAMPISTLSTNFVIQPSQAIVPVMTEANFYCQIPTALIVWSVNGTQLGDGFFPHNITTSRYPSGNDIINRLTILALPEYNGTSIKCGGHYPSNNTRHADSPSVKLFIQGRLSAIKNIRRIPANATIRWIAPFSLNLTNAEPDITYCVKVYNITCGLRALLVNTCSVFEPFYVNNSTLNKADLFEISVTPQSNVENAIHGIQETVKEQYIYFYDTGISPDITKTSSDTVDVQVHLSTNAIQNRIAPGSYVVSLESINGTIPRNFSASIIVLTQSLVIFNVFGVPYGDIYFCTIYGTRCDGISVSDITTLSTFDIQNVAITAGSNSSSIFVECKIINGSEASGVLVIAFSTSDASDIHYKVSPSNDQQKIQAVLSCLPGEDYQVVLYVLNETGLPLKHPAMLPSTRQLNKGESYDNQTQCIQEKTIKYKIYAKDDKVCVECNSTCVVIVHQNVTLLNTSGELLTIHLIHVIDETSNTNKTVFFECIPGINLDDYQIGVISLIKVKKYGIDVMPTESGNNKLIIIISATTATTSTMIIISVAVIIVCVAKLYCGKLYKRKLDIPPPNNNHEHMEAHREPSHERNETIANDSGVHLSTEIAPMPVNVREPSHEVNETKDSDVHLPTKSLCVPIPVIVQEPSHERNEKKDSSVHLPTESAPIPVIVGEPSYERHESKDCDVDLSTESPPIPDIINTPAPPLQSASSAGDLLGIPERHKLPTIKTLAVSTSKINEIFGTVTPSHSGDLGYGSRNGTPASSTAGSRNPIPHDSPAIQLAGLPKSEI